METNELNAEYTNLYSNVLSSMTDLIDKDLRDIFSDVSRIDRISVRAKNPDRFLQKALKLTSKGERKYLDPLNEIQDLIGARIITYYLDDLEIVENKIRNYYSNIEMKKINPEMFNEFGYEGLHYILHIPLEIVSRFRDIPNTPLYFELQIKTLFQHAWAESEHDLGYKNFSDIDSYDKRLLAYAAAQSWGVDRIFNEIHQKTKK